MGHAPLIITTPSTEAYIQNGKTGEKSHSIRGKGQQLTIDRNYWYPRVAITVFPKPLDEEQLKKLRKQKFQEFAEQMGVEYVDQLPEWMKNSNAFSHLDLSPTYEGGNPQMVLEFH